MPADDQLLYFLAGPEAAAIVREALDGVAAYRRRLLDALAPLGISTYYGRDRHFVAASRPGDPPPGWRRAPRRDFPARYYPRDTIVPDRKHPDGLAFLAAIGRPPSWDAVEHTLGIERAWKVIANDIRTGIRMREASYGAEQIGDAVVITAADDEGQPFGGAPRDCTPLARSAYWAMREAEAARKAGETQ